MTITPYQSIITTSTTENQSPRTWLDFFNPQSAFGQLVAYAESRPSSRNPERPTVKAYLSSVADMADYLGAIVSRHNAEDYSFNWRYMEMPTKESLQAYIQWSFQKGRSAKTIARHLAPIRLFVSFLEEQQVIPRDGTDFIYIMEAQRQLRLAAGIKNPPADYRDDRPELDQHGYRLTITQVNRLFEGFTGELNTIAGLRDNALLYLGITSGLRAAELARVTLKSISLDQDNTYIVQVRRKRNNYTPCGIDSRAVRHINDFVDAWNNSLADDDPRRITPETPVFQPILRGDNIPKSLDVTKGITPRAISEIVYRHTLEKIGEGIKAHDMRRTCAYLLRAAGVEWDITQNQMGHKSIATTQRYVGRKMNYVAGLLSNYIDIIEPRAL